MVGDAIAHDGWAAPVCDSEETMGEPAPNGPCIDATDGQPQTYWHTNWTTVSTPFPHKITVNMGKKHQLTGFRYLPRPSGNDHGTIKDYEFYVSNDGVNWGPPIAKGTFDYGTPSDTTKQQEVRFCGATAQYFRLVGVSEINANPWASCAELNVLGE
jgi:hypothetical protein